MYTKMGKSNLLTVSLATVVQDLSFHDCVFNLLIYFASLKVGWTNYPMFLFCFHLCFFVADELSNTVEITEKKTSSLNFIARSRSSMEIYLVWIRSCQWLGVMEGAIPEGEDRVIDGILQGFEIIFLGKGRIFPQKLQLSFLKRGCFLGFLMFSQVGMARQPGLSIQTWWYSVLAPCVLYIALHNVNEHLCLCVYPKQWNTFSANVHSIFFLSSWRLAEAVATTAIWSVPCWPWRLWKISFSH